MFHHGMSLRDVRREWITLGGTATKKRRTGEEVFWHPEQEKPITVNARRKDASRKLIAALNRIAGVPPTLNVAG
jgi:hypothetical protein